MHRDIEKHEGLAYTDVAILYSLASHIEELGKDSGYKRLRRRRHLGILQQPPTPISGYYSSNRKRSLDTKNLPDVERVKALYNIPSAETHSILNVSPLRL